MAGAGKVAELCAGIGVSGVYVTDNGLGLLKIIHDYSVLEERDAVFEKIKQFEASLKTLGVNLTEFIITCKQTQVVIRNVNASKKLIAFTRPSAPPKQIAAFLDDISAVIQAGKVKKAVVEPKKQIVFREEDIDALRKAVIRVMGPIGSIIVDDADKQLKNTETINPPQLLDLITIIRDDIEEQELITRFNQVLKKMNIAA